MVLLCGCVPLRGNPRAAPSSLGCMQTVRDRLPTHLPDKQTHCLATSLISSHCSVSEAYLAGVGKEFLDLFDGGDAEWGDLRADWGGVRCARAASSDAEAAQCCASWRKGTER